LIHGGEGEARPPDERQGLLAPYRVLDLTQDLGAFCGRMLADLSADVIKIEPPGGDPARSRDPFYEDTPHPERSLWWFVHHAGKRGITLDYTTPSGQELLQRLVRTAHVLIEDFPPGGLDRLGLGLSALHEARPSLVVTSITPFGQTGPYSTAPASDLELMALSGCMAVAGDPEGEPLRITHPQSGYWASVYGAAGTVLALFHAGRTGEGQQVDVSAQASLLSALAHAPMFWDLNRHEIKRAGVFLVGRSITGARMRVMWPCRDGYLNFIIYGGEAGRRTNQALIQWMVEKGMDVPVDLREKDWRRFEISTVTQEEIDRIEAVIGPFFKTISKNEFFQGIIERDMLAYPVFTPEDILGDPQLEARGFWEPVEHPELGVTLDYPGPFVRLSDAPCRIRRRAPLPGEHNEEIYRKELGLSAEELAILKEGGVI
jgi:crotonobetainyl-CoA:carnitine CoA-transferase CaiB-like acyl-CoA transferase